MMTAAFELELRMTECMNNSFRLFAGYDLMEDVAKVRNGGLNLYHNMSLLALNIHGQERSHCAVRGCWEGFEQGTTAV